MMLSPVSLILSSEHGVNNIPNKYANLFTPYQDLLETHRGIDIGSLDLAIYLHQHLPADFVQAQVSRLLIDCNRSLKHPQCFSEISITLPNSEKKAIMETYYLSYRNKIKQLIEETIAQDQIILHLSIHSFTPIWQDAIRTTDIGLLYDPRRRLEKYIAKQLQNNIKAKNSPFRIRMNYPYKGISDGFTTTLRKIIPEDKYIGLEIEMNQAIVLDAEKFALLKDVLLEAVQQTLANLNTGNQSS